MNEVEEFIKKNGVNKLSPDPRLSKVTGYALSNRYSKNVMARAAVTGYIEQAVGRILKNKKKEKRIFKKLKGRATEKQKNFLIENGVRHTDTMNKKDAYKLISKIIRVRNDFKKRAFLNGKSNKRA